MEESQYVLQHTLTYEALCGMCVYVHAYVCSIVWYVCMYTLMYVALCGMCMELLLILTPLPLV